MSSMTTQSPAAVNDVIRPGHKRAALTVAMLGFAVVALEAIALWAVGGLVAAAAGPLPGGLLVQADWRLIFFINVPVGAVALAALSSLTLRGGPRAQR